MKYILKYIKEPTKILYYVFNTEETIRCSTNIVDSYLFDSNQDARDRQDELFELFGLTFDIDKIEV